MTKYKAKILVWQKYYKSNSKTTNKVGRYIWNTYDKGLIFVLVIDK